MMEAPTRGCRMCYQGGLQRGVDTGVVLKDGQVKNQADSSEEGTPGGRNMPVKAN